MKLNVPNQLTIARILITPVFLAVLLLEGLPHRFLWAFIIFVAGSVTDAVDGHLARKTNQVTNFGKLLDPIADKVLTTSALLAFLYMGLCNVWIVMIILTREFTISSIRMLAAANGVVIPANIWGKIKTASQMVFTGLILFLCEFEFVFEKMPFTLAQFSNGILWITAILTVVSGIIYIKDSKNVIDYTK